MDLDTLLAARREAERDSLPLHDVVAIERELAAAAEVSIDFAWIERAARVVEEHQRVGRNERAWPLLRVMEPRLGDGPAIAARVLSVLSSQALLEGAAEAFLDRAGRAADAMDRAGDRDAQASVERAFHGAALLALGVDDEAERALDEAIAGADRAKLLIASRVARTCRARLALRRGAADEARAIAEAGGLGVDEITRSACEAPSTIGWLAGGPAPAWIAIAEARRASSDIDGEKVAMAEAKRAVLAFASKLARADLRKSYLERIPEHRRALSLDRS